MTRLSGFEHKASLAIARWVLTIFGGVYALSFLAMFVLFFRTDATFEKGAELINSWSNPSCRWSHWRLGITWATEIGKRRRLPRLANRGA